MGCREVSWARTTDGEANGTAFIIQPVSSELAVSVDFCQASQRSLPSAHFFPTGPVFEKLVQLKNLGSKSAAEESQAKLERFIASYPCDVRVQGDDLHIVVAIASVQYVPTDVRVATEDDAMHNANRPTWEEKPPPEFLREMQLPDLLGRTFLSTAPGNRVDIVRYDPPNVDMLEAMLYFPRTLPDGSPFIRPVDKELRFETRINGKGVKVKFDLKKLLYKGKLEN